MPVANKITALFAALTRQKVDALPHAQRARFAQLCRHWADFASIRPETPKAGVLVELQPRRRDE
jgi:hypothetical protein